MVYQKMNSFIHRCPVWVLVTVLTLVGLILRLGWLDGKPPWMDEVATVVFSLGNRTQTLPLNQLLDLQTFLQPLQPHPGRSLLDGWVQVIGSLFAEDNHPPTYFLLANAWIRWLTPDAHVVSVWVARSLPAIFGSLAIPLTYWLGQVMFRSNLAGLLGAAVMMTSPYGLSLSIEARHYSMAVCCVLLSLICFAIAIRHITQQQPFPLKLIIAWVVVNAVGLSVHYFFVLTLLAQGITLFTMSWRHRPLEKTTTNYWYSVYGVTGFSGLTVLLWVPVWLNFWGSNQSSSLKVDNMLSWLYWINPLAQSIWTWVTAVMILPTDWVPIWVIVVSALIMLGLLIWGIPRLVTGYRTIVQHHDAVESAKGVWLFLVVAIAIFFLISYGFGTDITRGGRYAFVYFPAIMVLVGGGLAGLWERQQRRSVQIVLAVGLVSAMTVIADVGYAKFYYPDRLLTTIQTQSSHPVVLAAEAPIEEKPTVVGIELLSIGWELTRNPQHWQFPQAPRYVLLRDTNLDLINRWLPTDMRPVDLWLFNRASDLSAQGCQPVGSLGLQETGSYRYQHYHCQ